MFRADSYGFSDPTSCWKKDMISGAECQLIGGWRIARADLWDRDYLDLVQPAYFQINRRGWAEFAFGALTVGGKIESSRTTACFLWTASTRAMKSPAKRWSNSNECYGT